MNVHIGEFINLIKNSPVQSGDTISRSTMADLVSYGLAKHTEKGLVPTDRGLWVYNQFTCKTMKVEEAHSFDFNLTTDK